MINLINKKKFLDDYMTEHGFRYPITYKVTDYYMGIAKQCFKEGLKEYQKFSNFYLNKTT